MNINNPNPPSSVHKPVHIYAILDEPRTIADKVLWVGGHINSMTNNTYITTPLPTILAATGHYTALTDKQSEVPTRTLGIAAERDADYKVCKLDILCWKAQVQLTADNNPSMAIAIIQACGFKVKQSSSLLKPILKALMGNTPNSAKLIAKSLGRNSTYEWQQSYDGENWTDFDRSTNKANVVANNIKAATLIFFRFRASNSKIETDWCDPVAFIRL